MSCRKGEGRRCYLHGLPYASATTNDKLDGKWHVLFVVHTYTIHVWLTTFPDIFNFFITFYIRTITLRTRCCCAIIHIMLYPKMRYPQVRLSLCRSSYRTYTFQRIFIFVFFFLTIASPSITVQPARGIRLNDKYYVLLSSYSL